MGQSLIICSDFGDPRPWSRVGKFWGTWARGDGRRNGNLGCSPGVARHPIRTVRRCVAGRPVGGGRSPSCQSARALYPQPRGLLHVVDLLRLGRAGQRQRLRFPAHIFRSHPDARPWLAGAGAAGQDRQGGERRLDLRLPVRPLRQEPGGGGPRHRDGGHRRHALSGAAVEGDHHQLRGADGSGRRQPAGVGGYRAARDRRHGRVLDPVRRPPHPRQRASPGACPGGGVRVAGQAGGLPGGGIRRHLRDHGRTGGALGAGRRRSPPG